MLISIPTELELPFSSKSYGISRDLSLLKSKTRIEFKEPYYSIYEE